MKDLLKTKDYEFLKTNEHLGDKIILLGLGGSHAYGTNVETSDIDIRGIALNSKREIILNRDFRQVEDNKTDTVIYSLKKAIGLFIDCNPSTIEMLGLKPEHYLYMHPIGKKIIDNAEIFLSKRAISSFGGYANQQLRKLENGAIRDKSLELIEKHLLNTLEHSNIELKNLESYGEFSLYLGEASEASKAQSMDNELCMDINLKGYPVRDYMNTMQTIGRVIKDYNKMGRRNSKAKEHDKLDKHSMHLVRLYFMALDILQNKKIVTYRENEIELLRDIRAGKFLGSNGLPNDSFYDLVHELEKKFEYAKEHTELPEFPNIEAIDELVYDIYYNEVIQ